MPPRTNRYYKRRRRYKRWKRKPKEDKVYTVASLSQVNLATPYPSTMTVKLKYVDDFYINPGALIYTRQFGMNNVFDPDETGVGIQYFYFASLCSATGPYLRYRVKKVSYKIQMYDVNTTVLYSSSVSSSAQPIVDWDDGAAYESAQSGIIRKNDYSNSMVLIKGTVVPHKIAGVPFTHTSNEAAYNADPGRLVLMNMKFKSADGATNMTSLGMIVSFHATIQFFDKQYAVGT